MLQPRCRGSSRTVCKNASVGAPGIACRFPGWILAGGVHPRCAWPVPEIARRVAARLISTRHHVPGAATGPFVRPVSLRESRNAIALSGLQRTMHTRLFPCALPDRHSKVHIRRASAGRGGERRSCGSVSDRGCKKERGQAPLRHTLANRPLLPSGPGGVGLLTVAQDLASIFTFAGALCTPPSARPHGLATVELIGFEPTTSSLRTRRSPS